MSSVVWVLCIETYAINITFDYKKKKQIQYVQSSWNDSPNKQEEKMKNYTDQYRNAGVDTPHPAFPHP